MSKTMKRTIQKIYVIFIYTCISIPIVFSQQTEKSTPLIQQAESTIKEQVLLFNIEDIITQDYYERDKKLKKGITLRVPLAYGMRYGVLMKSNIIDPIIRIDVGDSFVFKDLYLGENAGVLFSIPQRANNINQKNQHIQNTSRVGDAPTAIITALAHNNSMKKNGSNSYTLEVYTIPPPQTIETLPSLLEEELNMDSIIMERVMKEYAIKLTADTRIYVYMNSSDFDTFLEFSNWYGKSIVSDDWTNSRESSSSLITGLIPRDDTYYILASSFNGAKTGQFFLDVQVSNNEKVFSYTDKITNQDTKIFDTYMKEYSLPLTKGEVRTIVAETFSEDINVIFANSNRSSLYVEKLTKGNSVDIPIYAQEDEEYKIILLYAGKASADYSITVYK